MSEQDPVIQMTEAQFREHLTAAMMRGIETALTEIRGYCDDLLARYTTTTPEATAVAETRQT
jgi:hypothetical protein